MLLAPAARPQSPSTPNHPVTTAPLRPGAGQLARFGFRLLRPGRHGAGALAEAVDRLSRLPRRSWLLIASSIACLAA